MLEKNTVNNSKQQHYQHSAHQDISLNHQQRPLTGISQRNHQNLNGYFKLNQNLSTDHPDNKQDTNATKSDSFFKNKSNVHSRNPFSIIGQQRKLNDEQPGFNVNNNFNNSSSKNCFANYNQNVNYKMNDRNFNFSSTMPDEEDNVHESNHSETAKGMRYFYENFANSYIDKIMLNNQTMFANNGTELKSKVLTFNEYSKNSVAETKSQVFNQRQNAGNKLESQQMLHSKNLNLGNNDFLLKTRNDILSDNGVNIHNNLKKNNSPSSFSKNDFKLPSNVTLNFDVNNRKSNYQNHSVKSHDENTPNIASSQHYNKKSTQLNASQIPQDIAAINNNFYNNETFQSTSESEMSDNFNSPLYSSLTATPYPSPVGLSEDKQMEELIQNMLVKQKKVKAVQDLKLKEMSSELSEARSLVVAQEQTIQTLQVNSKIIMGSVAERQKKTETIRKRMEKIKNSCTLYHMAIKKLEKMVKETENEKGFLLQRIEKCVEEIAVLKKEKDDFLIANSTITAENNFNRNNHKKEVAQLNEKYNDLNSQFENLKKEKDLNEISISDWKNRYNQQVEIFSKHLNDYREDFDEFKNKTKQEYLEKEVHLNKEIESLRLKWEKSEESLKYWNSVKLTMEETVKTLNAKIEHYESNEKFYKDSIKQLGLSVSKGLSNNLSVEEIDVSINNLLLSYEELQKKVLTVENLVKTTEEIQSAKIVELNNTFEKEKKLLIAKNTDSINDYRNKELIQQKKLECILAENKKLQSTHEENLNILEEMKSSAMESQNKYESRIEFLKESIKSLEARITLETEIQEKKDIEFVKKNEEIEELKDLTNSKIRELQIEFESKEKAVFDLSKLKDAQKFEFDNLLNEKNFEISKLQKLNDEKDSELNQMRTALSLGVYGSENISPVKVKDYEKFNIKKDLDLVLLKENEVLSQKNEQDTSIIVEKLKLEIENLKSTFFHTEKSLKDEVTGSFVSALPSNNNESNISFAESTRFSDFDLLQNATEEIDLNDPSNIPFSLAPQFRYDTEEFPTANTVSLSIENSTFKKKINSQSKKRDFIEINDGQSEDLNEAVGSETFCTQDKFSKKKKSTKKKSTVYSARVNQADLVKFEEDSIDDVTPDTQFQTLGRNMKKKTHPLKGTKKKGNTEKTAKQRRGTSTAKLSDKFKDDDFFNSRKRLL
ncbi:hypothetical protein HDU92_007266 [Lobulomyces angularis]|nr:hypothetical protein HDU92_007266 [Lobulomyces angularis]